MKLYLITANDDDDDNFDLIVQANSIERAVELWREHWVFGEGDDGEEATWSGEIVMHVPDPLGGYYEEAARVWQIDNNPDVEGVVHWGGWTEIEPNPHYPAGRLKIVAHVPYR